MGNWVYTFIGFIGFRSNLTRLTQVTQKPKKPLQATFLIRHPDACTGTSTPIRRRTTLIQKEECSLCKSDRIPEIVLEKRRKNKIMRSPLLIGLITDVVRRPFLPTPPVGLNLCDNYPFSNFCQQFFSIFFS